MSQEREPQELSDSGKRLHLLVSLGTVPEVVTCSPAALSQYTKDTFNVELVNAGVRSVSLSGNRGLSALAVVASGGIKPTQPLPAPPQRSHAIVDESKAVVAAHAAAEHQSSSSSQSNSPAAGRTKMLSEGGGQAAAPLEEVEGEEVGGGDTTTTLDSLSSVSSLLSLCQQQARQIGLLETALADSRAAASDDGPRTALVAERGRNLLLHAELEDAKDRLRGSEGTVQEFAGVISKLKDDVRQLVEMHSVGDFHGSV